MTHITNARRATVRAVLANSSQYDATTMVIRRDGIVTAIKDADKTFNGTETIRYNVAHIDDIVTADGSIREGYCNGFDGAAA
jgi:hypothetical protein